MRATALLRVRRRMAGIKMPRAAHLRVPDAAWSALLFAGALDCLAVGRLRSQVSSLKNT